MQPQAVDDIDIDVDFDADDRVAAPHPLESKLDEEIMRRVADGRMPVPPFPSVAMRLAELVRNDAAVGELVRVIGADQALSAEVLRAANAATYGSHMPANDLNLAIQRIGTKRLSDVCFGAALAKLSGLEGPLLRLRRRVWQESVVSALVSEELAMLRGEPPAVAYLAGLLHDFGKVIVIAALEQVVVEQRLKDEALDDVCLAVAERHHAEIGFILAEAWNLPQPMPEIILGHHAPRPTAMFGIVSLADAVVDTLQRHPLLSLEHVSTLPGVKDTAEAERIMRALQRTPPLISAMCSPDAPRSVPTANKTRPSSLAHAVACDVGVRILTKPMEGVRAVELAPGGVVLSSPQAMAESWIAHVRLEKQGAPFELWLNVRRCERDGGSFRVECVPFALTGDLKAQWLNVVRSISAS